MIARTSRRNSTLNSFMVNNAVSSTISKVFLVLVLAVTLGQINMQAQSQWKTALIVPGGHVIASGKVEFKDCFHNIYNSWGWCNKGGGALSWNYVQPRVQRNVDFQLTEPGYVYVLFTSRVDKDWRYDTGSLSLSALNKNGKWEGGVWLGPGLRYASYRGTQLVSTGPYADQKGIPPLKYRLLSDGKVQFYESIPKYQAGRYRLTLTEAYFRNNNNGEQQYHPCTLTYKLIFVPDRPVSSGGNFNPPNTTGGTTGSSGSQLECPTTRAEAYKLYTYNYTELKKLMDQGKGDAPEAQVYYKRYKFYRDCYNEHYNGTGSTPPVVQKPNGTAAANRAYLWALNAAHRIYFWNGRGWSDVEGRATDVGVGMPGDVWITGDKKTNGGFNIQRWTGTKFVEVPGGAVRVDVGPGGTPWAINKAGNIYRRVNGRWEQISGRATDIGIGADGSVFVTGAANIPGGHEIYKWTGKGWKRYPGAGVRIDVDGHGRPWVVNNSGKIFHWYQSKWIKLPGLATDVTVGPVGAWITGTDNVQGGHGIYQWIPKDHNWRRMPGGATAISVAYSTTAHGAPKDVLKSGKYNVDVNLNGKVYHSRWKIKVKGGVITGVSHWSCCPGKRKDPVHGKIKDNTLIIHRDCSGQGWSGACMQTYRGSIKGDRIKGKVTGTGITGKANTWVLDLKSWKPLK